MGYLLGPPADRPRLRRLLRRIDEMAGYPRDITAEVTRIGRTPPGGWADCTTDAAVSVYVHDDTGPAQLHGAWAIHYGPEVVRMVAVRLWDPEDGGGKRALRDIITELGWVIRTDAQGLPDPGDETRQPWTRVAHRDGEPGSTTGVPIPEGEE